MEQIKVFSPNPGIAPDYASMAIDAFNYGNGKCKDIRPDVLLVINNGDSYTATKSCGRFNFSTACGDEVFIINDIHRVKQGNHVAKICCTDASKHRVKLTAATSLGGDCDTTKLQFNLRSFEGCEIKPILIGISEEFRCSPDSTAAQKIAKIIASANANPTFSEYAIAIPDAGDTSSFFIEWKREGEFFTVEFFEGFKAPEVVQIGLPAIGKGNDLKTIFKALDCLPGACDSDKCYTIYIFKERFFMPIGTHGIFPSSSGQNNNNSQVTGFRTVWIAVDEAATAAITAIDTLFNNAELLCSTDCQGGAEYKTFCLQRTDAGNGAALTSVENDYDEAVSAVRVSYDSEDGISYYQLTYLVSATDPTAKAGDTITEGICD